jgi:hypothetical protein
MTDNCPLKNPRTKAYAIEVQLSICKAYQDSNILNGSTTCPTNCPDYERLLDTYNQRNRQETETKRKLVSIIERQQEEIKNYPQKLAEDTILRKMHALDEKCDKLKLMLDTTELKIDKRAKRLGIEFEDQT